MKSEIKGTIIAVLTCTLLICACGIKGQETADPGTASNTGSGAASTAGPNAESSAQSIPQPPAQEVTEAPAEEAAVSESSAAVDAASVSETGAPDAPALAFTYADLTGLEFYFSSGAGGWATTMTINADGTFSGNYHDSDMGDTGDQYPNGTMYYCDFKGNFGELTRVDDYTYRTELKSIELADTPETEEIKDGVKYVYTTAYGLDDAKDVYFYLPGKPVSELPEAFVSWVQMTSDLEENGKITIYGMYNETAENGFGGYPAYDETASESTAEQIKAHVEEVQKQADEIEKKLDNEDINQMEMNQASADLYKLWDDELNKIWQYLKEKMPEAEMQELTAEEREWISDKEARIAEEGKQYAGGSIQPLVENRLAAQLTRERVYELLTYVNE